MRDALEQRVHMERNEIDSQEEEEDVAPVAEPSLAPTFFEPLEPTSDVPAPTTLVVEPCALPHKKLY